ncbi:hypothetical protein JCM5353_008146 [Sporobolomyces roseus]
MDHFPPSPPSSISLPDHFSCYPLYGSDPPPTDGPNTREKLSKGLLPRSGRIGPVLPSRDQGEVEGYEWDGEGEGERSWDSIGTIGRDGNYLSQSTTSTSEPYYSSLESATPYPDSLIDPILRSSTTSNSSLYSTPPDANDSGDFSFYPPPLPHPHHGGQRSSSIARGSYESSSQASFEENQRICSNATIIDHGQRCHEGYGEEEEKIVRREEKRPEKVANGLGITKEEWLRLGGFSEEGEVPPVEQQYHQDVFTLPSKLDKALGNTLSSSLEFTLPLPIFPPPTPVDPSPTSSSTFSYFAPPPPPPPPPSSVWEGRSPALTASDLSLPTPPSHFKVPQPPPPTSTPRSSPTKQRSALPSPLKQTRSRPEPYPTTSTLSSQPLPLPQSQSQSLALPPLSPQTLRNLTPVSTALLQYSHYPIPSHPPVPSEFPKKSHGRRTSPNHIPRPRNAFILFRSHAVSTGLIPKSAGIKDAKNVSQVIGKVWKGLSEGDRKEWEELAKVEKLDHARKWPGYKYTPRQKKKKKNGVNGGLKEKVDQDGEWEEIASSSPEKTKRRGSTKVEKEKMELIGQGLLENEYGQLPVLPFTTTTSTKPRYPTGDIIVSHPPQSSHHRSSPHSQSLQTTPTKFRPLPSHSSSPASSNSPSPQQRMPLPYSSSRPSPNSTPSRKHPLSNSHGPSNSSSPSKSSKKSHYSLAGLGIQPTSSSMMDQIPLFKGPTESRQFSLGKFALSPFHSSSSTQSQPQNRKPSSYREFLAQQQEEVAEETRNFTSLDPSEFLASSGLSSHHSFQQLPTPSISQSQSQAKEEDTYSVWDDTSSSISSYSTAPTTISSNWNRPLDFGQPQSQLQGGGGGGGLGGGGFHFGTMDLFSKPKGCLFNSSSSRSQAQENVGSGIRWEGVEGAGGSAGGDGR